MVIKMKCPKCDGLMMYEKFLDMGESSTYYFYGCGITCGTIIDDTIIENRYIRRFFKRESETAVEEGC